MWTPVQLTPLQLPFSASVGQISQLTPMPASFFASKFAQTRDSSLMVSVTIFITSSGDKSCGCETFNQLVCEGPTGRRCSIRARSSSSEHASARVCAFSERAAMTSCARFTRFPPSKPNLICTLAGPDCFLFMDIFFELLLVINKIQF